MKNRIVQISELLKKEVGRLLLENVELPQGVLATISRVEATPNLQQASVYVGVFPDEQQDEVLRLLEKEVYQIQQQLNKRLKMRPVPKIQWRKEVRLKAVQDMEKLLNEQGKVK